ncbi:hypothetical protein [Thiohalocapsa sp.]|uniref:hypothetical protein n=1 Tax=Thiohalocapsa sp. TaxID=2497641 RepID=UPI0025E3F579|nr:hypothetical protein [Thiohalocapsa sp.]
MQQRTQLILTATATFFAGLLTGATVFSDVLREAPPVPEPASVPEMVSEPPSAEEAVPDVASVTVPASAPEPPQDAEPDTEPALSAVSPEVTDALAARIEELTDGWGRMQAELAELRQRVARVERDAAEPDAESADGQRRRPASPAEQRAALLRAGVTAEVADDLIWPRSQLSLATPDLRAEAARDGWLSPHRYREA